MFVQKNRMSDMSVSVHFRLDLQMMQGPQDWNQLHIRR